ncbi:MAG: hypothetical protein KJ002_01050, partial [Candidatus Dadabacteria bacterium]|nr:hypothetical protein [Candidatus Dadabacteria bacterium]
ASPVGYQASQGYAPTSAATGLFLRGDLKAKAKTGFPIKAFGNDRNVVIPRTLEIVGNDSIRGNPPPLSSPYE